MRGRVIYFVSVLILIFSFGIRIWLQEPETTLPKNQKVTLTFTIHNEPRISYDQQVINVGDGKVYTSMFPKYHVGDRLKIDGKADVFGRIYNAKVEKVGQASGFIYQVAALRNKIAENIFRIMPDREATLVVGAVLGVDNMDPVFRDQLIKTGTIHVVVVSGQNLMIVAAMFMAFSKQLGRRLSLVFSITAVFLYAILAGFEPPVMRASLMVLASSLALFSGRESVALLNLFAAALVILFISPQALFDVSFQLTFAASLGIMTLGQKIIVFATSPSSKSARRGLNPEQKSISSASLRPSSRTNFFQNSFGFIKRDSVMFLIAGELTKTAAIPISAFLFTAPVIFLHFQRLSLWSPLTNILVAEAVAPVMILGFLIAIASLIFMPLAQLLAYFAFVPAFYFVKVVEIFSIL